MSWIIDDFVSTAATGSMTVGAWLMLVAGCVGTWVFAALLVGLIRRQARLIAMRWHGGYRPRPRVARPARPAKTASQGWSAKLARPIVLRDNMTLETLADARAFVVAISDSKGRDAWQSVAAALLRAAKDSHLIEAATSDLELTLLVQGLLKLTASESISPESEKFEPALHEHWR